MSIETAFGTATISDNYQLHIENALLVPWAHRLIEFAGVRVGQVVLDVASGTGVVARAAATTVGQRGRVIANDISALMLANVAHGFDLDGAPIAVTAGSATELRLPDASVDVVLCQQGLQFIADPDAAVAEMFRVLRPGGVVAIESWAAGARLDPLDTYADALRTNGVQTRSHRPISNDSVKVTEADVAAALKSFLDVAVLTERVPVRWPTVADEVAGIFGTPFGPLVDALDAERRAAVLESVRTALGDSHGDAVEHVTVSVMGRGIRP
ncbi:MAG: methyltransferase domain-containing protein [Rhodoglobus sp.]